MRSYISADACSHSTVSISASSRVSERGASPAPRRPTNTSSSHRRSNGTVGRRPGRPHRAGKSGTRSPSRHSTVGEHVFATEEAPCRSRPPAARTCRVWDRQADGGRGLCRGRWAEERLTRSHDYWVATVRAEGRRTSCRSGAPGRRRPVVSSSLGRARRANLAADPRARSRPNNAWEPVAARGHRPKSSPTTTRWRASSQLTNAKYETDYGVDFLDPAVNATFRVAPSWVCSSSREATSRARPTRGRSPRRDLETRGRTASTRKGRAREAALERGDELVAVVARAPPPIPLRQGGEVEIGTRQVEHVERLGPATRRQPCFSSRLRIAYDRLLKITVVTSRPRGPASTAPGACTWRCRRLQAHEPCDPRHATAAPPVATGRPWPIAPPVRVNESCGGAPRGGRRDPQARRVASSETIAPSGSNAPTAFATASPVSSPDGRSGPLRRLDRGIGAATTSAQVARRADRVPSARQRTHNTSQRLARGSSASPDNKNTRLFRVDEHEGDEAGELRGHELGHGIRGARAAGVPPPRSSRAGNVSPRSLAPVAFGDAARGNQAAFTRRAASASSAHGSPDRAPWRLRPTRSSARLRAVWGEWARRLGAFAPRHVGGRIRVATRPGGSLPRPGVAASRASRVRTDDRIHPRRPAPTPSISDCSGRVVLAGVGRVVADDVDEWRAARRALCRFASPLRAPARGGGASPPACRPCARSRPPRP